jgi:hypothetical protein
MPLPADPPQGLKITTRHLPNKGGDVKRHHNDKRTPAASDLDFNRDWIIKKVLLRIIS